MNRKVYEFHRPLNFYTDRWISSPTRGIIDEGQGQGEGREEIVQRSDVAEAFAKEFRALFLLLLLLPLAHPVGNVLEKLI